MVDLDEQKRLVENLGDSEVMILRNHGLLAVGKTIGQAFNNIYRLERACQTQLLAMACNSEINMPPAGGDRALERPAHRHAVARRQGQAPAARLAGMAGAEAHARPARSVLSDLSCRASDGAIGHVRGLPSRPRERCRAGCSCVQPVDSAGTDG